MKKWIAFIMVMMLLAPVVLAGETKEIASVEAFEAELLPETDVDGSTAAEYFASMEDEIAEAAAAAQVANEMEFDIFVFEDSDLTEITAPLALQRGISGEAYYYRVSPMCCMHVMPAQ